MLWLRMRELAGMILIADGIVGIMQVSRDRSFTAAKGKETKNKIWYMRTLKILARDN